MKLAEKRDYRQSLVYIWGISINSFFARINCRCVLGCHLSIFEAVPSWKTNQEPSSSIYADILKLLNYKNPLLVLGNDEGIF